MIRNPLNTFFLAEVPGESSRERFQRMRHNVFATVAQCVQPSTRETYECGWRRWLAFCEWFGVDPYLRQVPSQWEVSPSEIPVNFKEMALVAFMQKLCIDEELCPGTVAVYLSGVRHVYKIANLDIVFFSTEWVAAARSAVNLLYRKDHPIAGRVGLPFTCDMIVHAESLTFNTGSTQHHAILTALKLATTCLMRVSEYLPGSPNGNHWLRADDVVFMLKDGRGIPSWRAFSCKIDDVRSVVITVRSAKNDIEGEGHRFEFHSAQRSSVRAFDLVVDLFTWAVRARPSQGHPFLSYRGEWRLSYATLSKAIKLVAQQMGLDPSRYRTHSLRIGGASMLAAAQVPDYVIQKLGRWKSLAFLEYIRLGQISFDVALAAMMNPTLLTVAQVGRMHAGAVA